MPQGAQNWVQMPCGKAKEDPRSDPDYTLSLLCAHGRTSLEEPCGPFLQASTCQPEDTQGPSCPCQASVLSSLLAE